MHVEVNTAFSFGEFEIDGYRRLISRKGTTLTLNPKAFDLLLALVQNHGRVLTKGDLLDLVWADQFVEENNLTVHIAAIRKALGESKNNRQYIVTVPGKGYRFVAPLNDYHARDIIVESHKLERIVVEDVVNEATEGFAKTEPPPTGRPATGTESAIPRQTRIAESVFNRPFTVAAFAAVLLLAVIATGFAIRGKLSVASAAPFLDHRMRQLTTNGKVGSAALSDDGKLFAYTVDDLGMKSLWVSNTDGGNQLELRSPAEATYRSIAFSPDGSHLYFSIRGERNPKGALFRMPVFGGAEHKVLDEIGSFSLSPDGKQIAIARSDKQANRDVIVIVPLDGSARRDAAIFEKERSFVFDSLSWSADGTLLALSAVRGTKPSSHQLAVVDIASGVIARIEHDNLREITKTRWINDGTGVILTAVEPASVSSVPQYRLWHISYPDGKLSQLTNDRSNYGASWHNDAGVSLSLSADTRQMLSVEHRQLTNVWVAPVDDLAAARQITFGSFGKYDGLWGMDWTPEGKIIFTTSDTQSQFLAEMNADGIGQRPLTAAGMIDSVLTVANDGRYVLFHSNRGGDFDIWRADIDGSDPKQLTFGGQGFHPAPSPDGKWVYYKSFLTGAGELMRVPIDGGESERITDRETSWGSFSPDGKYFAASYITDKQRIAVFSAESNQIIRQFDLPPTGTLFMGSRWYPDSSAVMYRDRSFGYWLQPIDGGPPTKLEGLPREKLYNFAWSKDGKFLAFVRGPEIRDVVLFESSPR